jgi:hypothetical protein
LTPELVKKTLGVRTGQIKRLVVKPKDGTDIDEVTLILSRVGLHETQVIAEKLQRLPKVSQVSIVSRAEEPIVSE